MKKIPTDIDQLMWTLAEEGNPRAVEEFEQRFPEHRYELAKRVLVVRQLRGAKGRTNADGSIPRFQPRISERPAYQKPLWGVAALAALFALAFASYSITKSLERTPQSAPVAIHEKPAILTPPESVPEAQLEPNPGPVAQQPDDNHPPDVYQRKINMQVDRAPLYTVLNGVAQSAGFKLQILPGLENPDISIEYHEQTGIAILEDMGKQLGFTPSYESDGLVIIVPAVDPKKQTQGGPAIGSASVVEDKDADSPNRIQPTPDRGTAKRTSSSGTGRPSGQPLLPAPVIR